MRLTKSRSWLGHDSVRLHRIHIRDGHSPLVTQRVSEGRVHVGFSSLTLRIVKFSLLFSSLTHAFDQCGLACPVEERPVNKWASGIFVEVHREDERTQVVMDTVDDNGEFLNQKATTLTMIDPSLKTHKIEMTQSAPGRYEAKFSTDRRGTYQVDLAQARDGETVRQSRGVVVGYPDELRLLPTAESKLRRIAESSGGRFNPDVYDLLEGDERTARMPVPLWPYLLMAALTLFIFDVALRRIELPRLLGTNA